jgi:hypothetical protein
MAPLVAFVAIKRQRITPPGMAPHHDQLHTRAEGPGHQGRGDLGSEALCRISSGLVMVCWAYVHIFDASTLCCPFSAAPADGGRLQWSGRTAGAGKGITSGQVGWVTLSLAPGHYELVCNVQNHYADGMHREFTVT